MRVIRPSPFYLPKHRADEGPFGAFRRQRQGRYACAGGGVKAHRGRNHTIEGRSQTLADPELLTLQGAARYTDTSDTTIKKLVDAGVLAMRQVVPFAPWEIRRPDLETEQVRAILDHLKRTGRLPVGDPSDTQRELFQ